MTALLLVLDPAHAAEVGDALFAGLRQSLERRERVSPEVVALARRLVANRHQPGGQPSPDGPGCPTCGNDDGMFTTSRAARHLGMSTSTLYRRVSAGQLTPVRDGGRFLFDPADLDRYLHDKAHR